MDNLELAAQLTDIAEEMTRRATWLRTRAYELQKEQIAKENQNPRTCTNIVQGRRCTRLRFHFGACIA